MSALLWRAELTCGHSIYLRMRMDPLPDAKFPCRAGLGCGYRLGWVKLDKRDGRVWLNTGRRTKMTEDGVRRMRETHAAGGRSLADIAKEFDVSITTVHAIVNRKTWRHVS